MHGVFGEFALLLLMSAAAGAVSLWLRQPVLIAYIAMGIVAGPAVLGVVTAHDQIDLLAQVGVAVAMMVMSALRGDGGAGGEGSLLALAGSLALRIGIAGVGLYLLMRYILPRVVDRMAQSQKPAACSPCSCCCRTAPG